MDENNDCFLDMVVDTGIEHYFPGGKAQDRQGFLVFKIFLWLAVKINIVEKYAYTEEISVNK